MFSTKCYKLFFLRCGPNKMAQQRRKKNYKFCKCVDRNEKRSHNILVLFFLFLLLLSNIGIWSCVSILIFIPSRFQKTFYAHFSDSVSKHFDYWKSFPSIFFFPSLMIALLYGTEGILSNCISLIVKKRPFRRRVILALFTFTSNKTTRCEKVFRFTPNRYYI